MYLKSLTLKGFKSFASPTTLRFEPGITCVVGPNGSGKSNVVDALAWVMGEQGAKTLRGGKMEDVIFAGTSSRAPLGRAEVTLTIDDQGVAQVRLNRPEKLNALNPGMIAALDEILSYLSALEDLRCVVLAGEGRSFCAGIDLAVLAGGGGFHCASQQMPAPGGNAAG